MTKFQFQLKSQTKREYIIKIVRMLGSVEKNVLYSLDC